MGSQVPLRDGLGAYFWWSLSVVDVFVTILSRFDRFLLNFSYFFYVFDIPQEPLIFVEKVVILKGFRVFYF